MSEEAKRAIEAFADAVPRPRSEVAADLASFETILLKWQQAKNLVSRETLTDFWSRHVSDSLQLLPLIRASDNAILDLGSGGGFPALPLAICSKNSDRHFCLVESNHRKCAFLRQVKRDLALPVDVFSARIENAENLHIPVPNVITARALANLRRLFSYIAPLAAAETRLLLHKGREFGEEVEQAAAQWQFDMIVHDSITDPEGVILEISSLQPQSD